MPEIAEESEAHGVRRRPVDRPAGRAVGESPLADAERAHQRLLVAHRALVRLWRDNERLAHRVEGLLEREQPARLDTVIVGDEDPRSRAPVGQRSGGASKRSRASTTSATRQWLSTLLVEVATFDPRALAGHVRAIATAVGQALDPRSGPAVPIAVPGEGVEVETAPGPAVETAPGPAVETGPGPAAVEAVESPAVEAVEGPPGDARSSTSGSIPGEGSRGMRTSRPSRAARRSAARRVMGPVARTCPRMWKKNAETTAAIGMPKIAPAIPPIFEPMRTEAMTTIGWMPTACSISRGWSTFMTMIQPIAIAISVGSRTSGFRSIATSTGGARRWTRARPTCASMSTCTMTRRRCRSICRATACTGAVGAAPAWRRR